MTLLNPVPLSLVSPEVFTMKSQLPQRRPLQLRRIQLEDGSTVTVRIRVPVKETVEDFAATEASGDHPERLLPVVPTDSFDPSL